MRRRKRHRTPHAPHPPVHLPIAAVFAERPYILRALLAHGVPARDRDDVFQLVAVGAWRSIEAGLYRPDPSVEPRRSLLRWLYSLCWRHAGHYRERAHVRREIPTADPWAAADEPAVDAVDLAEARDVARLLEDFPKRHRDVLALAADGHGVVEIAHRLAIPVGTASNRLRRVRDLVAERLDRMRGRP